MAVPRVNLRKIKRKSGTYYMLDFTVDGIRKREIVGKNKRSAELVQARVQNDLTLGTYEIVPEKKAHISLDGLIKEFLESKKNEIRESSLIRYKNYYARLQDFMDEYFPVISENIRRMETRYINECFDQMKSNNIEWSDNTIKSMKEKVSSLFKYAVKRGYIDENPVVDSKRIVVTKTEKVEYFTDEELKKIYEALDPFWVDHIKFMVCTGIRKGEMINLKWENVGLDNKTPVITIISMKKWKTKTGEYRVVPLNKTALEIIKRWQGKNSEYVFSDNKNKKIHSNKPYNELMKALMVTGINGNVHKLRHTFASKLVMSGVDLYTVKELLGHKDIKTTQIYAHLSQEHLEKAVKNAE